MLNKVIDINKFLGNKLVKIETSNLYYIIHFDGKSIKPNTGHLEVVKLDQSPVFNKKKGLLYVNKEIIDFLVENEYGFIVPKVEGVIPGNDFGCYLELVKDIDNTKVMFKPCPDLKETMSYGMNHLYQLSYLVEHGVSIYGYQAESAILIEPKRNDITDKGNSDVVLSVDEIREFVTDIFVNIHPNDLWKNVI